MKSPLPDLILHVVGRAGAAVTVREVIGRLPGALWTDGSVYQTVTRLIAAGRLVVADHGPPRLISLPPAAEHVPAPAPSAGDHHHDDDPQAAAAELRAAGVDLNFVPATATWWLRDRELTAADVIARAARRRHRLSAAGGAP